MKSAIKWMAENHVAANLLMIVLLIGGLIKMVSIKQEIFPEVSLDMIQIQVPYPGAGPEEVEEGIILKIEDNLTGIDGIKEINSSAVEGMGVVTAELRTGENPDILMQNIKSEVDRIVTFPQRAEKPIITKMLNLREVISVAVYGDVSPLTLREQAEIIRDELLNEKDITQVELSGVREHEIAVEIPEENLQRYGLTLEQVASQIRMASLDLPGGNIKTSGGEILLRTKERRYKASEYSQIVVMAKEDGSLVRLRDIAKVRDTFEETDLSATFDGKPAAMVKVFRVADQKPTEISDIVKAYVKNKQQEMPSTLSVGVWNDTSIVFRDRMNLLIKNASLGLILVFVVLGLFLEIRLALWVMLGIPISFFGAMILMPSLGVSINMITLFAFILALGILVDDAIVVGESIFEHRQLGKSFPQAAKDGVLEVAIPVIFSVLTTVAAFSPLLYVTGTMGKFMKAIPLVVISLLMISLIESLFVLPSHLSGERKKKKEGWIHSKTEYLRIHVSQLLERFVKGPYKRFLEFCLSYRYVFLCVGITTLLLTIGMVRSGLIKFSFMPDVEGDIINVSLRMPPGTPIEKTKELADFIVQQGLQTVKEIDNERPDDPSMLKHLYAVIGGTIARGGPAGGGTSSASHMCDMSMSLVGATDRNYPTNQIVSRWREKVGALPGIEYLTFSSNLMHMGADIDIQLAHSDFKTLEKASDRLKEAISEYPGVYDLKDTYQEGKKELKLTLTPQARSLGVTEQDLALQVRSAFYGAEALRLQIGRNEVKVMVRYPREEREHLLNLEKMRIRLKNGGEMPFYQAAHVVPGRGFSTISRNNRKRVINVQGQVDDHRANSAGILAELEAGILPQLARDYPGLSYGMKGEEERRAETMSSMMDGFFLALLAIYALMAIPFKSYSQPLLIMVAIPFGIIGAIFGHLIMGYNLSMLSLFGVVALSGVVVNDSLILIDRINTNMRRGLALRDGIVEAAIRRFRPILLTSLTTFFGLTPMILETSVQAKFLIPMAISLGFGILFSTMITLLLIPSLYLILNDFSGKKAHEQNGVDQKPNVAIQDSLPSEA